MKIRGINKLITQYNTLAISLDKDAIEQLYQHVDAKYFKMLSDIDEGAYYENEQQVTHLWEDICILVCKVRKI